MQERLLWAKKNRSTGEEHPLLFHLWDTAQVAVVMWERVLQSGYRRWIAGKMELCDRENYAGRLLAFWAGLHDIGKACPTFQERSMSTNPVHHGIVTAVTLRKILVEQFGHPEQVASQVATILGGHHGVFPQSSQTDLSINSPTLGGPSWHVRRVALTETLEAQLGLAGERDRFRNLAVLDHAAAMTLAGFVSIADWLASNEKFFGYADNSVSWSEYFPTVVKKARNAVREIGWDAWKPPTSRKTMHALFPRLTELRPLQDAVVKLVESLETPGLVVIESPMGEGKTAAMYLADHWARVLGQRGCYFALPTQATSDQMFGRVNAFVAARYPDDRVNLMLLHGHAALSAEFESLRRNADEVFAPSEVDVDVGARGEGSVVAAEWFTYRKRGLLAPFGVGTVDQALLAVLQTKHVFVRLFGLAHKTVILDEVHAYDAYMSTLIERLLEWLAAMGSSVVLLSATLPTERRRKLLDAYARGAGVPNSTPPYAQYPLISWVVGSGAGATHIETSDAGRKALHLEWVDRDPSALGLKLQQALADGGCAAIICNTVGRAQKVYQALKPFFPDRDPVDGLPQLGLLHARYLYGERERREKECLRRFGPSDKTIASRPRRAVLVATQIIEQSLDLDFDLMVTDLAPADFTLQRAGRLHRHARPERPVGLKTPTLWICQPEKEEDGVPFFGRADEYVYDRHVLLRSWMALKSYVDGRMPLLVPENVEGLVSAVYDKPLPLDTGVEAPLRDALRDSEGKLQQELNQMEGRAKQCRILSPSYPDDILEEFNRQLDEDNPSAHLSVQALTRPSDEPRIPVIFLYGDTRAPYFDLERQRAVNLSQIPDMTQAALLLRNSLDISHRGLVPHMLEHGLQPSSWRKCALLRHHRVMFLDGDGKATEAVAEYDILFDKEVGLIINRPGKEG